MSLAVDLPEATLQSRPTPARRDLQQSSISSPERCNDADALRAHLKSLVPDQLARLSHRLRSLSTVIQRPDEEASSISMPAPPEPPQGSRPSLPFDSRSHVDVQGLSDRAVESMLRQLIDTERAVTEPPTDASLDEVASGFGGMSDGEIEAVLELLTSASAPQQAAIGKTCDHLPNAEAGGVGIEMLSPQIGS